MKTIHLILSLGLSVQANFFRSRLTSSHFRTLKERTRKAGCKALKDRESGSFLLGWARVNTQKSLECGKEDAAFGPSSESNFPQSKSAKISTNFDVLFSNKGQLDEKYDIKNKFDRDMMMRTVQFIDFTYDSDFELYKQVKYNDSSSRFYKKTKRFDNSAEWRTDSQDWVEKFNEKYGKDAGWIKLKSVHSFNFWDPNDEEKEFNSVGLFGKFEKPDTRKHGGRDGCSICVVAFRGSTRDVDWDNNFKGKDILNMKQDGYYSGFYGRYLLTKNHIRSKIRLEKCKHVIISGHSLGGAVATIQAIEFNKYQNSRPNVYRQLKTVNLITLAAPRACTLEKQPEAKKLDYIFNIVKEGDIVPRVPPSTMGFKHTTDGSKLDLEYSFLKGRWEKELRHMPLGVAGQTLNPSTAISRLRSLIIDLFVTKKKVPLFGHDIRDKNAQGYNDWLRTIFYEQDDRDDVK